MGFDYESGGNDSKDYSTMSNVLCNDVKLQLGQTYDARITKENLLDRTVLLTTVEEFKSVLL